MDNITGTFGLYDDYSTHITCAQVCLPYMVQYMVYPNFEKAVRDNWRLGTLHAEWASLLSLKRICILGPRDHLKSFFCAICYPLQVMWRESNITIRLVSSTDKLAVEKLDWIKKIIEMVPEFRYMKDTAAQWDRHQITLANGSSMLVHGYEAKARGGHPNILMFDDPIDTQVVYSEVQNQRSIERFYAEYYPMAERDTQILMIGTVQREGDLYGSLSPETWTLKTYSAILDQEKKLTLCPELWDWDNLEKRRQEIVYKYGDRFWRKEYLNDPKALVGQIFREEWFRYFQDTPVGLTTYVGMDPSVGQTVGSDYTAIAAVGINSQNHFYILDMERGRWTLPDRLRVLERMCKIHEPRIVGIESVAFSFDTVQQAIETFRYPVSEIKCSGAKSSKMARAEALSVYFRNEKIHMRCLGFDNNNVPMLDKKFIDLRDELIGFPGNYDDQVDALHIAVTLATREGWKPMSDAGNSSWLTSAREGSRRKNLVFSRRF